MPSQSQGVEIVIYYICGWSLNTALWWLPEFAQADSWWMHMEGWEVCFYFFSYAQILIYMWSYMGWRRSKWLSSCDLWNKSQILFLQQWTQNRCLLIFILTGLWTYGFEISDSVSGMENKGKLLITCASFIRGSLALKAWQYHLLHWRILPCLKNMKKKKLRIGSSTSLFIDTAKTIKIWRFAATEKELYLIKVLLDVSSVLEKMYIWGGLSKQQEILMLPRLNKQWNHFLANLAQVNLGLNLLVLLSILYSVEYHNYSSIWTIHLARAVAPQQQIRIYNSSSTSHPQNPSRPTPIRGSS